MEEVGRVMRRQREEECSSGAALVYATADLLVVSLRRGSRFEGRDVCCSVAKDGRRAGAVV